MPFTQLITTSSYGPQNTEVICFLADSRGTEILRTIGVMFSTTPICFGFTTEIRDISLKLSGNLRRMRVSYQPPLFTTQHNKICRKQMERKAQFIRKCPIYSVTDTGRKLPSIKQIFVYFCIGILTFWHRSFTFKF
jgi:hypothetical protein